MRRKENKKILLTIEAEPHTRGGGHGPDNFFTPEKLEFNKKKI